MILKESNLFCNDDFSFIADGELFKDFVMLHVGIKYKDDRMKEQIAGVVLKKQEMKELRDYIDKILKTCEGKESE